VGFLGLGMQRRTFHAEAGRQQWKRGMEDSRVEVETLYKISNSSTKPAGVIQTHVKISVQLISVTFV